MRMLLTDNLLGMNPARVLRAVLVVGLLHGMIYVFLVPPWQHNDEPGHFEYTYLAARWSHWPRGNEFDPAVRQEIVQSLKATGWYKKFRSSDPADLIALQGSEIGPVQVGESPGYYFLAAQILRFFPAGIGLVSQLYAVRLFSLGLSILTIFLAWLAMGELVNSEDPLRWMVPLFIALLPAYADIMTSVSNDVGGIVAGTFYCWISLRILLRRPASTDFALWGASLAACFFMNETSRLLLITAPLVLVFSFIRGIAARVIAGALAALIVLAVVLSLRYDGPSQWFRVPNNSTSARSKIPGAPFGQHALDIVRSNGKTQLGQFLPPETVQSLRTKKMTLGVWMWANRNVSMTLPILRFVSVYFAKEFRGKTEIGLTPTFHAMTFEVPAEAGRAILIIPTDPRSAEDLHIYYDAVVLAEGSFSEAEPVFADADLANGTWDDTPFVNLVRNPSFEQAGPVTPPWLDAATLRVPRVRGRASLILASLQDPQGTGWYYRSASSHLFQTFWATAGGGKAVLPGLYDYNLLKLLTLIAALGVFRLLWRKRTSLAFGPMAFLGVSLLLIWGVTFMRGVPELTTNQPVIPWARYAGPVIVVSALLICAGWREAAHWAAQRWGWGDSFSETAFIAILLGLSVYALLSFSSRYMPSAEGAIHLSWFVVLILFCFQILRALRQA